MWSKIKKISRLIFKISLAIFIVLFMVVLLLTLAFPNMVKNSQLVNTIAIIGLVLSLPGIVNQLAQEVNPKKSRYRLKSECPNCKQKIEMEMIED